MAGRPFPLGRGMEQLVKKFHKEISEGIGLVMLKEQEIGSSPSFFTVEADHIDRCLTGEQEHEACSSQGLPVFGFNVNGNKWNLQLLKENGTYFFIEETTNKMTEANGWEPGTEICLWGVPDGRFRDGKVRFLFTYGM